MDLAGYIAYSLLIGAVIGLGFIAYSYIKGLKKSPRDMWFLFLFHFIEYAAYGAMNLVVILWLSKDCGLGDVAAGSYIAGWSMMLSIMGIATGSVVDTIGIKRTLFISVVLILISRFFMAFVTNPTLIFILGFVPLALGFAIVGPLVSVAIKRYTTKEGAALGFGLFYVIMNIAYAVGGVFFDWIRSFYVIKDAAGKIIDENAGSTLFGMHFSTYQLIFIYGLIATAVSLFVLFFLRDGVEVSPETGETVIVPSKKRGNGFLAVKNAIFDTAKLISSVVREKYFWIYMGLLSLVLPVRFVFFHFNYTLPKYGVRVLGEGAKIGSIFLVLNPVLIVFFVPIVAYLTKKTSSYRMMIVGSCVSALSCFIAVIPAHFFAPLTNTVFGELVFVKWLGLANSMPELIANPPSPVYWLLIILVFFFTIGEAIWSPRLMQFTAEVAPRGREGTYIALSILPFFVSKFFVGPMSGMLVKAYTPLDEAGKALASYPHHYMVWIWIGGMALISPIALLIFRKLFNKSAHQYAKIDADPIKTELEDLEAE